MLVVTPLHIEDCMCKSDGISLNISLSSVMAKARRYIVGNLSWNAVGRVPNTWCTVGIHSTVCAKKKGNMTPAAVVSGIAILEPFFVIVVSSIRIHNVHT